MEGFDGKESDGTIQRHRQASLYAIYDMKGFGMEHDEQV
jgi:hypothetical protein